MKLLKTSSSIYPTLAASRSLKPQAGRAVTSRQLGIKRDIHNTRSAFAGVSLGRSVSNGSKFFASQWLENSAEADVPVPLEKAWALWEDRESIPKFMPWIKSVTVQPENPSLSRWLLSTNQFGRDWEFSWLAKNLMPMKNQKIHWRSVEGSTGGSMGGAIDIANRGQIRFYRKSETTCAVKLTISYEVPNALAPFANALTPLVEGILRRDMSRFATYAQEQP